MFPKIFCGVLLDYVMVALIFQTVYIQHVSKARAAFALLAQQCLSLTLFLLFVDKISSRGCREEGITFENLKVWCLLLVDHGVILLYLNHGPRCAMEWFVPDGESAMMRGRSTSVNMRPWFFTRERLGDEYLPLVEELNIFEYWYETRDGTMDQGFIPQ